MSIDISNKTVGVIHAAVFTAQVVKKFTDEIIPEVEVMHLGDDTIQRDNMKAGIGIIPKHNFSKFVTYAHILEEAGADVIMLACSTFNPAVEIAEPTLNVPILQIDRPMMDLAVKQGDKIGILATLPMTIPSTERLLLKAASDAGKDIEHKTVLSSEAFDALVSGNTENHNEILLHEINKLSKEVDVIVLAQVSMTALEPYLGNSKVPVYNSGRTGVQRIKEILEKTQ
jgi:aspartate/glutamate racemase